MARNFAAGVEISELEEKDEDTKNGNIKENGTSRNQAADQPLSRAPLGRRTSSISACERGRGTESAVSAMIW
tara:strand:+ start:173 stop:388 length:216 start_codon:yes stop_codon:yes gene_type:complete